MTWYEFLLFAHIAMAVIWVGGGVMMQFFGLRAVNSPDPMRLAQLGQDIEWIGNRVLVPSSALAVVSGILLVIDSDFWGFGDDWIVIGLVLFAITFSPERSSSDRSPGGSESSLLRRGPHRRRCRRGCDGCSLSRGPTRCSFS